jgi:hypothetical protein
VGAGLGDFSNPDISIFEKIGSGAVLGRNSFCTSISVFAAASDFVGDVAKFESGKGYAGELDG